MGETRFCQKCETMNQYVIVTKMFDKALNWERPDILIWW